jgi:nicotinamide-nucleotide amidase
MSARAGILITGTEVLTGRVLDRNGPWLSDRLTELGIEHAHTTIVGDRPQDMLSALNFLAGESVDVIVTSGGLGPTADDLTVEVVAEFCGREMYLDGPLEERIAEILRPLAKRYPQFDQVAVRESNRKQAVVPRGATIIDPVGTAPGLVVPPADGKSGPTVVVLPGPPRELQPMWRSAVATEAFGTATGGAIEYRTAMLRMFGIPESEIAATLRAAADEGIALDELEITTCLRRGEIEVVTRYEPPAQATYDALVALVRERHSDTLYSDDFTTVDEQVATLLSDGGLTIGVCESCTGGLLAGRLTERPGSSAYVTGGVVAYANEVKSGLAHVDPAVIEHHGAISTEVAEALAAGAIETLGTDVGVGVTGIAGPDGGTPEKPVGFVCVSVASRGGASLTRSMQLPGSRADVRDRTTTVAMHMLRRLLHGETDAPS